MIGIEPTSPAWKAGVLPLNYTRERWGEKDSNLRRHTPADLQSAPFGRSGISPEIIIFQKPKHRATERTRTSDRLITNQLLYQLSYGGKIDIHRKKVKIKPYLQLTNIILFLKQVQQLIFISHFNLFDSLSIDTIFDIIALLPYETSNFIRGFPILIRSSFFPLS